MTVLGNILPTQDLTTKGIRVGTVTLLITDLTKSISFGTALPSTNYRVFLQVEENAAVTLWATAKTTSGFTINLSAGLVGSVAWMAIEDG